MGAEVGNLITRHSTIEELRLHLDGMVAELPPDILPKLRVLNFKARSLGRLVALRILGSSDRLHMIETPKHWRHGGAIDDEFVAQLINAVKNPSSV